MKISKTLLYLTKNKISSLKGTKKKIIDTTINLFNQHGFANVSLPDISKELKISLGNLTYHFPKKEELIDSIYATFQKELALITKDYKVLSDLDKLNQQLSAFYGFQQRFKFFYLDLLEIERAFPNIAKKHYQHIEGQIQGLNKSFNYNVGIGNLVEQESPRIYQHLAQQFWMCSVFWLMQLAVRGKEGTVDDMTESAWMLVHPYATEKGKTEFENIFITKKIN